MRCSPSRRRSPQGGSSSSRGSSRTSGSSATPPRPSARAAHRRGRRRSRATIPLRISSASRRPTMPTSCWSMRRPTSMARSYPDGSPPCLNARPRKLRSSPAAWCGCPDRFMCRSAAASTTGPRSSSARGSRPRRDRRCGSSAHARIRAAAVATPAVCSPMRRSPCSDWSRSTRHRCSPNRTPPRCSKRWRTAP